MSNADSDRKFTESEMAMLGSTADALSAYMGAAILAEVDETDGSQWVIFGRVLDENTAPDDDTVHVQIGGNGSLVLGQKGGLETDTTAYDCEFLWAIEITESIEERYVRLNPQGEVFDASPDLITLLPFSMSDPDLPDDLEDADA